MSACVCVRACVGARARDTDLQFTGVCVHSGYRPNYILLFKKIKTRTAEEKDVTTSR